MVHFFRAAILSCLCIIATQVDAQGQDIPPAVAAFNLMEKISEARSLLEKSKGLGYDEHPVASRSKKALRQKRRSRPGNNHRALHRQQIALAIMDKKTGSIFEKRYWLDPKEIV
ncbi:MAG: hypothetical protein C4518_14440, partial [Desulfobacteraceae bacterium]